jgi:hypothetical protein
MPSSDKITIQVERDHKAMEFLRGLRIGLYLQPKAKGTVSPEHEEGYQVGRNAVMDLLNAWLKEQGMPEVGFTKALTLFMDSES